MTERQLNRFAFDAHRDTFDLGIARHVIMLAALGLLLLKAGAIIGENAEIMVRKLEIIFRHHPVTLHLGVTGKILVFFQQLRGIAPRAVIDAVALFRAVASTATLRPRPGAIATTIIILAIVDQRPTFPMHR